MKIREFIKKRIFRQAAFSLLVNSYVPGFIKSSPYAGPSKSVCLPVLNCYSCPGAYTSCPVGTFQQSLYSFPGKASLFVTGMLGISGIAAGRWFCGNLCPFGLYQDLLKKISAKNIALPRILRKVKYIVLFVTVMALPLLIHKPAFCSYLCPAGTLQGGLTLVWSLNIPLGLLYYFKVGLLAALSGLSVAVKRPFCATLCPLGAVLGAFNRISMLSMKVDTDRCIRCGKCRDVCPSDINIYEDPGSPECLRCGDCVAVCPTGCIEMGFLTNKTEVPVEKI